jgi:hypothetical protein
MNENTDSRGKLITNLERALDPTRELHIEAQTKGFQLHAGIKMVVDEKLFDLCGKEPQDGMDIYISEDDGALFCCNKPTNYLCHFIGNVKDDFGSGFGKRYSIYIDSIVKGDRNPIKGSVEL